MYLLEGNWSLFAQVLINLHNSTPVGFSPTAIKAFALVVGSSYIIGIIPLPCVDPPLDFTVWFINMSFISSNSDTWTCENKLSTILLSNLLRPYVLANAPFNCKSDIDVLNLYAKFCDM